VPTQRLEQAYQDIFNLVCDLDAEAMNSDDSVPVTLSFLFSSENDEAGTE